MCEQCLGFGVICNYDPSIPDLEPLSAASTVLKLDPAVDQSPFLTTKPVLDMVHAAMQRDSSRRDWKTGVMRFDNSDLARLDKFQMRTILTIGVKGVAKLFQREVLHLACTHRFLMHMVQALTAAHDRYLYGYATARPCASEAYHISQALASFQTILSRPIHPDDRDSLMVASSLLGVVSFFNLEASSVEDVWPMVDCDFSWLNLSDGKKTVWKLVSPLSHDSLWRHAAKMYDQKPLPLADIPLDIDSIFYHLCSEEPSSTAAAVNPHYKTAQALIPLLEKECNDDTALEFLMFTCSVDAPFKLLLERRDPWALLILCYWFMKVCRGVWWMSSRAILQGQAICLYLERYHPKHAVIQRALIEPRLEFEAAQMDGYGGIASSVSSPRSESSMSSLQWV